MLVSVRWFVITGINFSRQPMKLTPSVESIYAAPEGGVVIEIVSYVIIRRIDLGFSVGFVKPSKA